MYTLTKLERALATSYQGFTFPFFESQLRNIETQNSLVAIGASVKEQPIGLVLAEIQDDRQSAKVLSIFVKAAYRRLGVGMALMRELEQQLWQRGCQKVEITYSNGKESTIALENLLDRLNWTTPQPRMLICKSTTEKIAAAPWLYKHTLPPELKIFPWLDLTPAQRLRIQQQQDRQPWYPKTLTPFNDEIHLEPLNSLALLYQDEVVGWTLNHRIAPNTIRYTRLFVREDLQKLGRAIALLAEAINRQVNSDIFSGIWTVAVDNRSMVNFVKRRLAPYLISLTETKEASKFL
jgi:GNAT superfamily N-acetyltransferase